MKKVKKNSGFVAVHWLFTKSIPFAAKEIVVYEVFFDNVVYEVDRRSQVHSYDHLNSRR